MFSQAINATGDGLLTARLYTDALFILASARSRLFTRPCYSLVVGLDVTLQSGPNQLVSSLQLLLDSWHRITAEGELIRAKCNLPSRGHIHYRSYVSSSCVFIFYSFRSLASWLYRKHCAIHLFFGMWRVCVNFVCAPSYERRRNGTLILVQKARRTTPIQIECANQGEFVAGSYSSDLTFLQSLLPRTVKHPSKLLQYFLGQIKVYGASGTAHSLPVKITGTHSSTNGAGRLQLVGERNCESS